MQPHSVHRRAQNLDPFPSESCRLPAAQVATTLSSIYGLDPPDSYTEWTNAFSFMAFDWSNIVIPAACVAATHEQALVLRCVGPIIFMAFVFASTIVSKCAGVIRRAHRAGTLKEEGLKNKLRTAFRRGAEVFVQLLLVMTFAFVPGTSTKIFSTLSCTGYERDYDEGRHQKTYFLTSDLGVECYESDTHRKLQDLMWVFVGIWPIGVVSTYILLLYPCRTPIMEGQKTPLVLATSFLTKDYEPHVYFWEALELFRRTVLTGWLLLIEEPHVFLRQLLGFLISLTYLVALLYVKPYRAQEDDFLAIAAQLLLTLLFLGCMLMKLFNDFEELNGVEIAIDRMVFQSEDQMALVLIISTVAMLAILVIVVMLEALRIYYETLQQDKWGCCTVETPTFNWEPTGQYCCFLSHYKME